MKPFINRYSLIITLCLSSILCVVFFGTASAQYYKTQQTYRQNQASQYRPQYRQNRTQAVRHDSYKINRNSANQTRRDAFKAQQNAQIRIKEYRQIRNQGIRDRRVKFGGTKVPFASNQKNLKQRSQVRTQQKTQARTDRLAKLQKNLAKLSKSRKPIPGITVPTPVRIQLQKASVKPSYKTHLKGSTSFKQFKNIRLEQHLKQGSAKQLEIQNKAIKKLLQTVAKTRAYFGKGGKKKTWNEFQKSTKGQFSSRAAGGKAWEAYKKANGIKETKKGSHWTDKYRTVTEKEVKVLRSKFNAQKKRFLKQYADLPEAHRRFSKAERNIMRGGNVPDNWVVHHKRALFRGGTNEFSNLRMMKASFHEKHSKRLHYYEKGKNIYGTD